MRRRMMIGQEECDVKEWRLIWDSGETEEEIYKTDDIDVSKYTELMVFARAVPTANNAGTRNGVIRIYSDDNRHSQLVAGSLIAKDGGVRLSKMHIRKVDDLLVSQSATSWNSVDVFEEGAQVDNMTDMKDSIASINNMQKIYISNLNASPEYYFGVGSRFRVYAR